MLRPLAFEPETEAAVRFVEDTGPAEIVAGTVARLRAGEAPESLVRAAALAVTRSTELPADHHGGPIHPVSGLHAVVNLARRLNGDRALLPAIQSVALANLHIHSPEMGPTLMAELESSGGDASAQDLTGQLGGHLAGHRALAAERSTLSLLREGARQAALDPILAAGTRRNSLDDHYFLYPLYTLRALDALGWDLAETLLRPPVRYLASNALMEATAEDYDPYIAENVARYLAFGELKRLIADRRLLERDLRVETGEDESEAIGALGRRIGESADVGAVPAFLAEALASGLSLEGTGEALSYGAGLIYLCATTGNPFDVHIHTGLNARRYLIGLDGPALETKLLALVGWADGPEVRLAAGTRGHPLPDEHAAAQGAQGLPSQADGLAAIRESIEAQPAFDLRTSTVPVENMREAPQVRETMALAEGYARADHDPAPFFALMAELVSHDEATEMHAYKMQQAAFEEFHATREPYRWVHMVAAARHLATVYRMLPQEIYPQAARLLHL
jgi:hypothetical protein